MAKQTISYVPQVLDLDLYAGDGATFRLLVTDTSDEPVILNGTMLAQIRVDREASDPPDAVFEIDLSEAGDGIAVLKLTGEQTQELDEYSGVWDVQWVATGEEPVTLCQGKVECVRDVSH